VSTQSLRIDRDIPGLADRILRLAREASIELNVLDLKDFEASRAFLAAGQRIYISHLPKQRWDETVSACRTVKNAGFEPIPHIPVRLLDSEAALDRLLSDVSDYAREVLLISGDYPRAAGPYSVVADVLRARKLQEHGLQRVSLAGHPEGHPAVALEEIQRAQIEKGLLAEEQGIAASYVTQFFFEAAPFLQWASELREAGVRRARLIAGLSGPAGVATLLKFAKRCGVGRSMRALIARPGAISKLVTEHGPEEVIVDLAAAADAATAFDGLHFFCFGGYLRTCEWVHAVASGRFELREKGFIVR
jgi:methylenetetrahydrofolate reductase (NADPH)